MSITIEQKAIVQASFEKVVPIAEIAADIFYTKLFELDPDIKPLFKSDIVAQGRKLMTMIGSAVKGLDNLDALIPVLQDLSKRHVGYGVTEAHYATVGAALLFTLEKGLGESWNQNLQEAWTKVYVVLSDVMKNAV